ncbi:MAG: adenylosuccinate lyase [Chloroflexi bacterium]|nr:adenylosuccinate lyase [Chloroflexota bacterium]
MSRQIPSPNPDYETYQSPYTWRYGSPAMRQVWSEAHKRRLWRQMWAALAETQAEYGLLRSEQVAELRAHVEAVNVARALEIEAEIHHDLMAELMAFAEQCPLGGGALHLGATSMDIEDNADALRMRQSLDMVIEATKKLLLTFAGQIEAWADTPLIAFTHMQPAEPSTLGYRLAMYAQDVLMDWENLRRARVHLRGKGFKGAVGSGASYAELLGAERLAEFETRLSARLSLPFFPIAGQTYPRKQDYQVVSALAGLGGSLYKFAFDLRFLQSPPVGELSEPFGKKQVGSSAMPFKRNPIQAEKIDSLARLLAQAPRLAWDNAAHSLLERTLDDSANRRTLLPESFLIADELLIAATRILSGLQVNQAALARNFAVYAPFAATERLLMALGAAGADRQAMHEHLRLHSLAAWKSTQAGAPNPLLERLCSDPELLRWLDAARIRALMDVSHHLGDAPQRARALVKTIRQI